MEFINRYYYLEDEEILFYHFGLFNWAIIPQRILQNQYYRLKNNSQYKPGSLFYMVEFYSPTCGNFPIKKRLTKNAIKDYINHEVNERRIIESIEGISKKRLKEVYGGIIEYYKKKLID